MKTTKLWKVLCLGLSLFLLIGLAPSAFAQSEESGQETEEEEAVQARPNPMEQTMKGSQTVRTLNMNAQKMSVKDAGGETAVQAGEGAAMQLQGETQGIGDAQVGANAAAPMETNAGAVMK